MKDNNKSQVKIINEYFGVIETDDYEFIYEIYTDKFIIKNEIDFLNFIEKIPKKRVTKGFRKYEDSTDPLLKKPEIDFKKNMVLSIVTRNWLHYPKIERIEKGDNETIVFYSVSKPEQIHQTPMGIGAYTLVVIPKLDGNIVFKMKN
ncbi:MAG TPA: hypothetical protein PLE45_06675 [Spirochaetota bacterium]|nr:hypothetical protein [Spirochaetota bacterium]HPP04361.1 hypothetical protein [Spirochaetota bacterium]